MFEIRKPGFFCPPEVRAKATGVYLAFPTTEVLKPTYRGHRTLVNLDHTKVGITTSSFHSRWSEYNRTFGGEVALYPLFELDVSTLAEFESLYLAQLLSKYPRSGVAREWFRTTEREEISMLLNELKERGGNNVL